MPIFTLDSGSQTLHGYKNMLHYAVVLLVGLRRTIAAVLVEQTVSKSVQQVAQPAFFLRIAERAESAVDADQKAAFEKLAAEVRGTGTRNGQRGALFPARAFSEYRRRPKLHSVKHV